MKPIIRVEIRALFQSEKIIIFILIKLILSEHGGMAVIL